MPFGPTVWPEARAIDGSSELEPDSRNHEKHTRRDWWIFVHLCGIPLGSASVRFGPPRGQCIRPAVRIPTGPCVFLTKSTPVGIRTPNLLIRSQALYPVELRVLFEAGLNGPASGGLMCAKPGFLQAVFASQNPGIQSFSALARLRRARVPSCGGLVAGKGRYVPGAWSDAWEVLVGFEAGTHSSA